MNHASKGDHNWWSWNWANLRSRITRGTYTVSLGDWCTFIPTQTLVEEPETDWQRIEDNRLYEKGERP